MKLLGKICICAVVALAVIFAEGGAVYADSAPPCYTVSEADGGYVAEFGEEKRFESLPSLIEELGSDGAVFDFKSVSTLDSLTIAKKVTLKGSLTVAGSVSIFADSELYGLTLTLNNGSLNVKNALVKAERSAIVSLGRSAVVLDYSARSSFVAEASEIRAESADAAIAVMQGTVELVDSGVSNPYGAAIYSSGTLHVGGASRIEGNRHGIVTTRPFYAVADGKELTEKLSVRYEKTFERGSFCEAVLGASEKTDELITLFDKNGEELDKSYFKESIYSDEKDIIAVYMPYRVKFYCGSLQYHTDEYISGEPLSAPPSPEKLGYSFSGWYKDAALTERFTFGSAQNADLNLFAAFSLVLPEFSVSSISAVYSGEKRALAFDKLTHPLSDSGSYSFTWYKDGEDINVASPSIEVSSVSDSGSYKCRIGFSVGGDVVFVITPDIEVKISPLEVGIPTVKSTVYNGRAQSPTIESSPYYTVAAERFTDAGTYTVVLTLTDPENSVWENGDTVITNVRFVIEKAENVFLSPPSVKDGYEGSFPEVVAETLFGEVSFITSSDGVTYTEGLPSEVGKYFLKAFVEGTENYSSLESEPIPFDIHAELPVGLKIDKLPDRTEYLAFEKLSLDGAVITVTYNSGRSDVLLHSEITVVYGNGECMLVADRCVSLVYGGASVPLSVSVKPMEYDLSGITVSSLTVIYNGDHQLPRLDGSIVGKDGIALKYSVRGGGTNVGTYEVTVEFSAESQNYLVPAPMKFTFTVEPMPLEVTFDGDEFVYDGTPKAPVAEALLLSGQRVTLTVLGAATDSGEYTATAVLADSNYTLSNPTTTFVIKKAILDLSSAEWSGASFTYNGSPHCVTLGGLPDGVKVVGYKDAAYTEAGKYTALAILSYDTENYVHETDPSLEWEILPAEYALGDFGFIDTEAVYDGKVHYPDSVGVLPVGFDGSSPTYRFSVGAVNVSDGKVKVEIIFESGSRNYNSPSAQTAFVTVLPKKITVEWSGLSATYDGEYHAPTAVGECAVEVVGKGLGAGEYTVVAKSLDPNYSIVNNKQLLVIEKAANAWHKSPGIISYYTSGYAAPFGEAVGGETKFLYYTDKELTNQVDVPITPGKYYMVAYAKESDNYREILSAPIEFEVVAVRAEGLGVRLNISFAYAMQALSAKDVLAYLVNNDGTETEIPFADLTVKYQRGEGFRYGDNAVTFEAEGFASTVELTVLRARYDMTGVHWENEYHYYDGTEKSAYLSGLPEGVTLVEYSQNSATAVGSYKLSAVLAYDTENYEPPELPDAWLVISKAPVALPKLGNIVYSGKESVPSVPESSLYTFVAEKGRDVGEYTVTFLLTDPDNYEFDSAPTVTYRVLPRPLAAELSEKGDSFVLTDGEIVDGDSLGEEYYREGGMIYLRITNPNYELTVSPVKAKSRLPLILVLVFLGIVLSLAVFAAVVNRRSIAAVFNDKAGKKRMKTSAEAEKVSKGKLETLLAVDVGHANGMISDGMAKSLVKESEMSVETDGRTRATVSINRISEVFSSGESVDINVLKERGLVPKDARSVKILADGVVDKPLIVKANSFSAAAVKMIALTGGCAYKVKTTRRKNKKTR